MTRKILGFTARGTGSDPAAAGILIGAGFFMLPIAVFAGSVACGVIGGVLLVTGLGVAAVDGQLNKEGAVV